MLARLFHSFAPGLQNVRANFDRFGLPRTATPEVMANFARYLGEFLSVEGDPSRLGKIIVNVQLDSIRAAVTAGRGVLAVTPHFGNWEFGALAIGAAFPGTAVLIRTTGDEKVDERIRKCRGANILLDVDQGLRGAWRVLEMGGIVCAAIDEPRSEGIAVDFLGGRTFFPAPLFRMAERVNAAVIPVRCARDAARHVSVETFAPANDAQDVARIFSEWISRDPALWVMLGRISSP